MMPQKRPEETSEDDGTEPGFSNTQGDGERIGVREKATTNMEDDTNNDPNRKLEKE
jgi:hypothetical protein